MILFRDEEIKYIDNNREERNKKYTECMSSFKEYPID